MLFFSADFILFFSFLHSFIFCFVFVLLVFAAFRFFFLMTLELNFSCFNAFFFLFFSELSFLPLFLCLFSVPCHGLFYFLFIITFASSILFLLESFPSWHIFVMPFSTPFHTLCHFFFFFCHHIHRDDSWLRVCSTVEFLHFAERWWTDLYITSLGSHYHHSPLSFHITLSCLSRFFPIIITIPFYLFLFSLFFWGLSFSSLRNKEKEC